MESFRTHPVLILFNLKECQFILNFYLYNSDKHVFAQLFTLCYILMNV